MCSRSDSNNRVGSNEWAHGVCRLRGIKRDQATGEMKVVFVVDDATSAFQPLIGPKAKRVLLLSNCKRRVTAERNQLLSSIQTFFGLDDDQV